MIDRLINSTGDFRAILGLEESNSVFDLSCDDWDSRFEVIRGVNFRRAKLAGKLIVVNFVECSFSECLFTNIKSEGHFSGAGNTWIKCKFEDVVLTDLIAPQSRFIECDFTNVQIHGFRLCQTALENCKFSGVTIEGMASRRIGNPLLHLEGVAKTGGNALFVYCSFSGSIFKGCSFAGIYFDRCMVDSTRFEHCDFLGIIGKDTWWKRFNSGDPFLVFLNALLNGIDKRLGATSRAYSALQLYVESYARGNTKSKDYSACLYSGEVPDDELDAVQDVLDAVGSRFPM